MPTGARKRNATTAQQQKRQQQSGHDTFIAKQSGHQTPLPQGRGSGRGRLALRAFFLSVFAACLVLTLVPFLTGQSALDYFVRFANQQRSTSSAQPLVTPPTKHSSQSSSIPTKDQQAKATRHLRPNLAYRIPDRKAPQTIVRSADEAKRDAVKAAFLSSWNAYVEDAFGADEYHPISRSGSNFSQTGAVGYFIIDILDVLLLTGERDEYKRARDWVATLDWSDKNGRFSVFETTIRTLGGLLSAHALCQHNKRARAVCDAEDASMFLTKAVELAELLRPAFEVTPTGLPQREVNFATGETFADLDNNGWISLAEATTIQLEFKYLAHITDDERWWTLAERPMYAVRQASRKANSEGLLPIFLDPMSGTPVVSDIRLGSRGDSYYEYLLKQYVQTNRTEHAYLDMYQKAMMGVKVHLLKQSPKRKLLFTAELAPRMDPQTRRPTVYLVPKQDHLVCFVGGSFMLGALHVQQGSSYIASHALTFSPTNDNISSAQDASSTFSSWSELALEDWKIGHELIKTCVDTYTSTKTGLSPEIAMFRIAGDRYGGTETDWYVKKVSHPYTAAHKAAGYARPEPLIDSRNILRPETVESLFIAFHLTGDNVYRQWGWQIFEAFQRHTHLRRSNDAAQSGANVNAFAGITDVDIDDVEDVQHLDRMETFWLAETLKYLYLLFDDQDVVRLDQWVFNTEAHPLPIFDAQFPSSIL